jgi:hypothetical protein
MYCSENCLDSDGSSAHKDQCNKHYYSLSFKPFKLDEFTIPATESLDVAMESLITRLISRIGLDNIKKTVLENKPMPSLLGDPRTRGFQDGKFEAANLEAILSLEDNFGKLDRKEVNEVCDVSISIVALTKQKSN